MMVHYLETKKQVPECILFYRLGDFYEMFFEDAELVSRELELTLTGKNCGLAERAPMCGVPFHAAESYITRLVENGHKVAVCEQVEDPKLAKGMVKREIVKIVTPGTNTSSLALDESRNNYIMCIIWDQDSFGISTCDVTTGDFYVTQVKSVRELRDEITKFNPSEIIANSALMLCDVDIDDLKNRLGIAFSFLENRALDSDNTIRVLLDHFKVRSTEGLGLIDMECGATSAGAMLCYLSDTLKNDLGNITGIKPYRTGKFMIIDSSTRRNLELTETLREKNKRGSLLWVLDKCKTAMGSRLIRQFIEQPLIDAGEIKKRQDFVKEFLNDFTTREEIREYLNAVYDLERLMGRVSYGSANPRDMIAFKTSLEMLPPIREQLLSFKTELAHNILDDFDTLSDICELIDKSIAPDPPLAIKEGSIIKHGYNEEIDRLRHAKTEGKKWLSELEEKQKDATGIKNLRVKYNKVFGYYFEVTNSFKDKVPEDWTRKQTLTNAERYTMPELKELEDTILNAEDRLYSLEYDIFTEIRSRVADEVIRIQKTAKAVAAVDAFASLAHVAERNNYVCPEINNSGNISIKNGRHPVVELMNDSMFIANDTLLDKKNNKIAIITGPNMAGKSTYMTQSALITLMAQIGSFVPAEKALIGLCDRIFTRVGASDDLASGQSTFMVEMTEVANILKNATPDSLLILDEIGRGTSTYDGLSIAWAVIEHIAKDRRLGAKTLFATHYHELTELEGKLPGVINYRIAVKEQGDDIVFLRKILRGGADKSYGIQVARLAGVPDEVLRRAHEICDELQEANVTVNVEKAAGKSENKAVASAVSSTGGFSQMSMFDDKLLGTAYKVITDRILDWDLTNMTPMESLNLLYNLQKEIKDKGL
ncbi:MAG: DNA mismatch repair protein MutS [Lachnospiraceae bacterium]|nr:DNA mismatch repair protein MutS [Lachnospiraceae bacterium]